MSRVIAGGLIVVGAGLGLTQPTALAYAGIAMIAAGLAVFGVAHQLDRAAARREVEAVIPPDGSDKQP